MEKVRLFKWLCLLLSTHLTWILLQYSTRLIWEIVDGLWKSLWSDNDVKERSFQRILWSIALC